MVLRFRKETYRWSPLAIVLLGLLSCVGLTDGLIGDGKPSAALGSRAVSGPGDVLASADAGEYANIVRVYIRNKETGMYLVADGDRVTCDAAGPGEAGLWEARFSGNLGHGGDVFLHSVAGGAYLTSDEHGDTSLHQRTADESARWIVLARPQGVWIVSQEFKWRYLRPDEGGQVRTPKFGRDIRSYWDVIQIETIK